MNQASADTVEVHGGSTDITSSTSISVSQQTNTMKQVENLIEHVRANRENIRRTWGTESPQYQAANEIMQKYFNENIKKLNIDVQGASLEELIAKLSLHEKDLPD